MVVCNHIRTRRTGLTLIELLVVLLIVGALLLFLVSSLTTWSK